ncbi:MAG: response regulator [Bdellovibrionales bacterium]|nr:response regulator [Bdellovibrionales bacterium]
MNRILFVEDEDFIRVELAAKIREVLGIGVKPAKSGNEAVEFLAQGNKFDLIVSDYHMPDGDGLFLMNYVFSNDVRSLFILYTSAVSPNIPDVDARFLGVVEKFDIEKLLQTIVWGMCAGKWPR